MVVQEVAARIPASVWSLSRATTTFCAVLSTASNSSFARAIASFATPCMPIGFRSNVSESGASRGKLARTIRKLFFSALRIDLLADNSVRLSEHLKSRVTQSSNHGATTDRKTHYDTANCKLSGPPPPSTLPPRPPCVSCTHGLLSSLPVVIRRT